METHVLIDLGLLCLLFSDALGALEKPPEVIGPDHVQLKAHLGMTFDLDCKAKTNCRKGLTMIYWLVNGSFPESLRTSRISETKELINSDGTIQRNLKVRNVTTEDTGSTFVCVVMNPEGVAKKHFTLTPFRKPAT